MSVAIELVVASPTLGRTNSEPVVALEMIQLSMTREMTIGRRGIRTPLLALGRVMTVADRTETRRLHTAEGMGINAILRKTSSPVARRALASSSPQSYSRPPKGSVVDAVPRRRSVSSSARDSDDAGHGDRGATAASPNHGRIDRIPGHIRWTVKGLAMAVIDDVRSLGSGLERSYEVYVRDRLKFRVGQIVYVAFSLDETVMGFAFPKDERDALIASDPDRFHLPRESELRFNWAHADLAGLDPTEAREFVSMPGAWSSPRSCPGPTT